MTQRILYILSPGTNISPFDVTLASDAGFHQILPFTEIEVRDVMPMVQDAIFARPPGRFNDTGVFIGGRDVHLAKDMLDSAKQAMVGPFVIGVFADPNGAYTTSASVVALVQNALHTKFDTDLRDKSVCVFGTGPVGLSIAVLAAQMGARTRLCQLTADDDQKIARRFADRYQVELDWVSGQTYSEKCQLVSDAEVIICAAKAGIRVLDTDVMANAKQLLVCADTNAVPPSGIANVEAKDNRVKELENSQSCWTIGSLAIGDIKYKTQYGLFEHMQTSEKAALIDFPDAYEYACGLLRNIEKDKKVA